MTIFLHNFTSVPTEESTQTASSPAEAKSKLQSIIDGWKADAADSLAAFNSAYDALVAASGSGSANWTPTGQTYSGTSVPATPPQDSVLSSTADYCGVDLKTNTQLNADGIIVSGYFRGAKIIYDVVTDYRWVQDVAPTPPGVNRLYAAAFSSTEPGLPNSVTQPAFNELQGMLSAAYGFYSASDGNASMMAALQAAGPIGTIIGGGAFRINSYTIFATYVLVNLNYNGNFWSAVPCLKESTGAGSNGEWHLESKTYNMNVTKIASTPETCRRESVQIAINERKKTGPKNRDKGRPYISRLPASPVGGYDSTLGSGYDPITSINTTCSGTHIEAPFVFDSSLLQADLPPGYTLEGEYHPPVILEFTTPGDEYLLQTGSLYSSYNNREGALVFDLHLKKWGKIKQQYKLLTDYIALNIPSYSIFSHTDLGITGGVFKDGLMYNFDTAPTEGYIKYGKLGYYRLGVVHFLETRLDFRRLCSGSITIESSLNGRTVDPSVSLTTAFTNINTITLFPNMRYRWYNIKLEGEWDLTYMEVRGNFSGRR